MEHDLGLGKNGRPKVYHIPKQYASKYSKAKAQAKFRNEEWAFDQDSWLQMWEESGVIDQMGRKPHEYCMVRLDPIEAWSPKNCIIITRRMHLKKNAYVELQGYPNVPWEERHDIRYKK